MTMKTKKPKLMQAGHSDQFQTPDWPIDILMRYIPREWVIWEPACGQGHMSARIAHHGNKTISTDIMHGFDFLSALGSNLSEYDAIITNPPYSTKTQWLWRCYEIGKPFALLMPIAALGEQERFDLYRANGIQLVMLPRCVDFTTPSGKQGGAWFYCAWFCMGLDLPDQITFPLD